MYTYRSPSPYLFAAVYWPASLETASCPAVLSLHSVWISPNRDHILLVSSYNFLVVVDTNHLIGLHMRVQHVISVRFRIENSHHLVALLNAWCTNVKKSHANSLGNREESNTVITQFPSEGFIAQDTNS